MGLREINQMRSYSKLTNLSKALASPTRISILRRLMSHEEWISVETLKQIPGETKSVLRHVKALKYLGIIESKYYNREAFYRIKDDAFFKMSEEFNDLFELFKKSISKKKDVKGSEK